MTALNYADKVYIGSAQASAVHVGAVKAWPLFKPTNIAGCVIWIDASKLNLANGAAVSAWRNFGSGPQPATFLSPAPTLRSNALNGLPVVKITKGEGTFRFTGTGITKDWTIIYIARRWRNTIGRVMSAQYTGAGSNNNLLIGFWNQFMDCAYIEGWHTDPGISGSGGSATTWRMYSSDSATPAATPRLFSNGALLGSFPTPPSLATWNGTLCIGHHDAEATENSDCEIAEVVMYNRKLSDAERQQVESYLRAKWNPPAFRLTDLGASLVGWFDGADASTVQIVGSGVNNWRNKGVGALTLNQTNDANRPTYANQTVTIGNPQNFVAASAPSGFDIVWLGKPRPAVGNDWRTLLRGTTSAHHVILENGSTRFGTYNAGYFPVMVGIVSPKNMTSNAAPAPYVTSTISEYAGGYEAWRAFDADAATLWHTATPITSEGTPWIKIDLGTPKKVSTYKYQARSPSNGQSWKDWVLDGSNDNSTWTRVDTVVGEPNTTPAEVRTFACDAPGTFRYWRWTITATWGTYAEAASLELHESLTWESVWGIGAARFGTEAVTMSRDGGRLIATGTTLTPADVPFISFGAYQGPPPSQGWGDLKEVIFLPYNSNAINVAEGYLAHKWGYAGLLPANHLYKATPP